MNDSATGGNRNLMQGAIATVVRVHMPIVLELGQLECLDGIAPALGLPATVAHSTVLFGVTAE